MKSKLIEAAQAVIDRWDSPEWKWAAEGHTADLIHALRKAVEQAAVQPAAPVAPSECEELQARIAVLTEAATDSDRLDWVLAHKYHRVQGSDGKGWSVLDCSNGLTFVVRGQPTAREAIDAARAALAQGDTK